MIGLFYGDTFYPGAGMVDFHGIFADRETALAAIPKSKDVYTGQEEMDPDWWQLVDLATMEVIELWAGAIYGAPSGFASLKAKIKN